MEQTFDFKDFSRERSVGWLLAVMHNHAAVELESRLLKEGLNLPSWPTLMMLWEEEGVTQSELANRCMTAHYTTTRVLDNLEKKGLVERRKHPTSRRAHLIYLTDEGRALQSRLIPEAMSINEALLTPLSADEKGEFLSMLNKLVTSRQA